MLLFGPNLFGGKNPWGQITYKAYLKGDHLENLDTILSTAAKQEIASWRGVVSHLEKYPGRVVIFGNAPAGLILTSGTNLYATRKGEVGAIVLSLECLKKYLPEETFIEIKLRLDPVVTLDDE